VTRRLVGAVLLALLGVLPARGQQRRCLLEIVQAERQFTGQRFLGADNSNYYLAGNAQLRCRNQNVYLGADSIESINGEVIHLLGKGYYRDDKIAVNAQELTYYKSTETVQARVGVRIRDRKTGSTLTGPYVDYLRPVKGVHDSAKVLAMNHPTVRIFPSGADTTKTHPWILNSSVLNGFGSSTFWAKDSVTLVRDSVRATADSLLFRTAKEDTLDLVGKPATLTRAGSDTLHVIGRTIRLALADDSIRAIIARDSATATSGAASLAGEGLIMSFRNGKLDSLRVWDRKDGATLRREAYDLRGDSIAVATPAEQLRGFLIVGRGVVRSPRDSALAPLPDDSALKRVPDRDTIWGGRIAAEFSQHDSAGTTVTRPKQILASGSAASLAWRNTTQQGKLTATPTYVRADTILILMRGGDSTGVAEVRYRGHADGLLMQKLPPAPDTTHATAPKRPGGGG
jgi:hypothetical protein